MVLLSSWLGGYRTHTEVSEILYIEPLTLSLPWSVLETFKIILPFESMDEIAWCDHLNETSSAVLSYGTIYI